MAFVVCGQAMTLRRFLFRYAVFLAALAINLSYRLALIFCLPLWFAMTWGGLAQNKYTHGWKLEFYPLFRIPWPKPPSLRAFLKSKLRVGVRRIPQSDAGIFPAEGGNASSGGNGACVQEILPPLECDGPQIR